MELYQIETFITVADEKNLTRASKKLHISQPSVSAHIKLLEDELNIKLFSRNSSGMLITSDGEKLYISAVRIINAVSEFKSLALKLNHIIEGNFTIGTNTDTSLLLLNDIIESSKTNYPNLTYSFIQGTTSILIKKVLNNEVNFSFIFNDVKNDKLQITKLHTFDIFLIGNNKLKSKLKLDNIVELSNFPWILPPQDCPVYNILNTILKRYNIRIKNFTIADNEETLKNLVKSGLGISILPEWKTFVHNNDFSILKLNNFSIDLNLIYLKNNENQILYKTVLHIIKSIWTL
ncbi:MAG: LysR family transcriptional regulator [Clostridiales bacterium]